MTNNRADNVVIFRIKAKPDTDAAATNLVINSMHSEEPLQDIEIDMLRRYGFPVADLTACKNVVD